MGAGGAGRGGAAVGVVGCADIVVVETLGADIGCAVTGVGGMVTIAGRCVVGRAVTGAAVTGCCGGVDINTRGGAGTGGGVRAGIGCVVTGTCTGMV